jgi:hypothetical protein
MERTTNNRSRDPNAFAFGETRRDPQRAPYGPSPGFSVDDSIAPFLTDLQGQPDPQEFAPLAASQRTSILRRFVAGGLVVSGLVILVAVFNSDVTRILIDKAMLSIGSATRDQSATQSAANQPSARQMLPNDDPAGASDPMTRATVSTSASRLETASREDIVNAYRAAQSQVPTTGIGNEGAAPSKTLDPETLAALMTRAKGLLARGDFAAARLLLERAANARDPTAAFLLAQTYDPVVLRVRDTRSITPNPVMARDWYRKAASFGSAEAQQRLTQLHN